MNLNIYLKPISKVKVSISLLTFRCKISLIPSVKIFKLNHLEKHWSYQGFYKYSVEKSK